MSGSKLTALQIREAIAYRDFLASQVQSFCLFLPFNKCLQLCGTPLHDRYLEANKLAAYLENENWAELAPTAGEGEV